MLIKESGNQDFEQPPVGTHLARCVRLIDIGTQKNDYLGQISLKRQIILGFELPEELMTRGEAEGKPFLVTRFYTMSLGEKANLRKDLENWRGKAFTAEELAGFDATRLIGQFCLLSLTEKEGGKVRMTGIMAAPKSSAKPPQVNPTVYLSLEPEEFDQKTFDGLGEKMKSMIRLSPEYAVIMRGPPADFPNDPLDDDSDIPDF